MSEILIILGEHKIALYILNTALDIIGKHAKLLYQKAYCLHVIGDKDASLACMAVAKTLSPEILKQIEKEFPHFKKRNNSFINNNC